MRPLIYFIDLSIELLDLASSIIATMDCIAIPYEDSEAFLNDFDQATPGCSILGFSGNYARSSECLVRLKSHYRQAQTVLVSRNWELSEVVQAMKWGASEIVDIEVSQERMKAAIEYALQLDLSMRKSQSDTIPDAILERLSAEDARIFIAILRGKTTKQVASELDLSVRTVHYRKKALLEKIGVKDRSEAIELVRKMRKNLSTMVA